MPHSDPDSRPNSPDPIMHLLRAQTFQEPQNRANRLRDRIRNAANVVAPQKTGSYKYKDIDYNDEIRILRIAPGKGDDTIRCTLIPCSLPDCNGKSKSPLPKKEYCALSYYWGTDDPKHKIFVYDTEAADGKSKKSFLLPADTQFIQTNLKQALQQLRDPDDPVDVWCDALCINQKNKVEKTAQVARMHEVYINAEKVCVWLGQPETMKDEAKETFDFLKNILDLETFDRFVTEEDPCKWLSIISLMKKDWFSRRWVIQELALAQDAWIRYGDQEMKWSMFGDAIALFMTRFPEIKQILKQKANSDTSSRFRKKDPADLGALDARALGANTLVTATNRLFRRANDGRIEQRLLSLEVLVSSLLLAFEASDPKDTIFAVLSIAKDTSQANSELEIGTRWEKSARQSNVLRAGQTILGWLFWPLIAFYIAVVRGPSNQISTAMDLRIQPNYQKSLTDVCADFMEYCIEKSQSLDILVRSWAPMPKPKTYRERVESDKVPLDEECMPSWIPSIEGSAFGSPKRMKEGRINGDSFVDGSNRAQYNASLFLKPRIKFGKFSRNNTIDMLDPLERGISDVSGSRKKDTMSQLPPKFTGILEVDGFQLDVISQKSDAVNGGVITSDALEMGGWNKDAPKGERELTDALWRTLCADRGPSGVHAPNWYRRACQYCLEESLSHDGDFYTNDLKATAKTPAVLDFLDRVQAVVWKRRFFLTKGKGIGNANGNGRRLFGMAPNEAREGDVVCIFLGCTVPVVLRRREDGKGEYKLIGECYVHSMMDGEAVSGDWPKKLETFKLR